MKKQKNDKEIFIKRISDYVDSLPTEVVVAISSNREGRWQMIYDSELDAYKIMTPKDTRHCLGDLESVAEVWSRLGLLIVIKQK